VVVSNQVLGAQHAGDVCVGSGHRLSRSS
jgi:hypothetical protein